MTATVTGTCASSGYGDCFVSLRTGPYASDTEVDRLYEHDQVRVVCQVHGENATSSVLGTSSNVWTRDNHRHYMANVYLRGHGIDPLRLTLRRC